MCVVTSLNQQERRRPGSTCVLSSFKPLQDCRFSCMIYLFWRRAGHQRCFSPTWLRRAEAPRLWASSMTPHGSCPGGAPVTATWKIYRGEHTFYTSTIITKDTQAKAMQQTDKPADKQYFLSFSLFACWETVNESVKLLCAAPPLRLFVPAWLVKSEFVCLFFVVCVRDGNIFLV